MVHKIIVPCTNGDRGYFFAGEVEQSIQLQRWIT